MRTLIDHELYPDKVDYAANARPRTISVVVVLMVTAIVVSYLGAYAVPTALVNAEMMAPWPTYDDPRPRWVVMTFVGVLTSFLLIGGLFQLVHVFQNSGGEEEDDA